MNNLRARLLFLVLCAASADALAQYVCIATDGESRSHYATGVIAQPTREMLEDFKLFVRKEYDLSGEPTASCGYQVTTADAKNFLASTKGIVRTGWKGHSAQAPSGTDAVNDDVAADNAEEWRIAEFISKGPLMPPSPHGPRQHCDNRFVVVIKTASGIGDAMYTATEDPAYPEFQKAEKWIRTHYPDNVDELRLLGMSFGRPVDSAFPNEEAVFADMRRANYWSDHSNKGCVYIDVKETKG